MKQSANCYRDVDTERLFLWLFGNVLKLQKKKSAWARKPSVPVLSIGWTKLRWKARKNWVHCQSTHVLAVAIHCNNQYSVLHGAMSLKPSPILYACYPENITPQNRGSKPVGHDPTRGPKINRKDLELIFLKFSRERLGTFYIFTPLKPFNRRHYRDGSFLNCHQAFASHFRGLKSAHYLQDRMWLGCSLSKNRKCIAARGLIERLD